MSLRDSLPAIQFILLCCALSLAPGSTRAQDEDASLIDFVRDVKPILDAKCLECHGPDEAKNDFRVDDEESMLGYLEPGDLESSSLWVDYLVTDDEDLKMPPADHEALTGVEFATIKLWIEEGAQWGEPIPDVVEDVATIVPIRPKATKSLLAKIWIFQGLFHPASIHFPIAMLSVSALFVLLSFVNRDHFEPAAYYCLWIGALGAIVASAMGWSYAQYEGYGSATFLLQSSSIDRHRWLGIAVSIAAVLLILVARSVRKNGRFSRRLLWLLGAGCVMAGVGIVGYQGGELTYGEGHYSQEYERLFPSAPQDDAAGTVPSQEDPSINEALDQSSSDDSESADSSSDDGETNASSSDESIESDGSGGDSERHPASTA